MSAPGSFDDSFDGPAVPPALVPLPLFLGLLDSLGTTPSVVYSTHFSLSFRLGREELSPWVLRPVGRSLRLPPRESDLGAVLFPSPRRTKGAVVVDQKVFSR